MRVGISRIKVSNPSSNQNCISTDSGVTNPRGIRQMRLKASALGSLLAGINSALPGLIIGILAFTMLCQAAGFFLVSDKADFAIGLWLGAGIAIFMAFHMAVSLNSTVERDVKGAQAAATRQNIIRYLVVVILFGILMLTGTGNPLAAFIGVMGLKISAYMQPVFSKMAKKKLNKEIKNN